MSADQVNVSVHSRYLRGHTLLELMIAILVGMFLVLGAFSVMASFEGNKRSTTAVNDALQSGNYGLFEIDKLIRSSGSGLVHYASIAAWGCALNFTPTGGSLVTSGAMSPPAPFASTLTGAGVGSVRLAPAVIFPGAIAVDGTISAATAGSDVLMVMLGGAGYGEVPIPVTGKNGPTLDSTVGFKANEWVLIGKPGGLNDCMITQVDSGYSGAALNNVVLPLNATALGAATLATNDYIVALGMPPTAGSSSAANFVMYGVGPSPSETLYVWDMLNGTAAQKVSDDIVIMRAVYGVDPTNSGTLIWTNPVSVTLSGTPYDFTPSGLLAGTTAADTALKSIRAIRVAMIVRAPLNEKSATNLKTSFTIFGSLPAAQQVAWNAPTTGNYRYREIETTIPVRNGLF